MAEKAWEEATYELNKRIEKMIEKKVFSESIGRDLLRDAIVLLICLKAKYTGRFCLFLYSLFSQYANSTA